MNIDDIIKHSYKDFHVRGLSYVCIQRSPEYTVKLYTFQGDAVKSHEVVNPHDHRYRFRTSVLAGTLVNYTFTPDRYGDVFDAYDYMTPLNGGYGFLPRGPERLARDTGHVLKAGHRLTSPVGAIHTIQATTDTIIQLEQWADEVPLDKPTSCWVASGSPQPTTDGLYSKFTANEIVKLLARIDGIARTSYLDEIELS